MFNNFVKDNIHCIIVEPSWKKSLLILKELLKVRTQDS